MFQARLAWQPTLWQAPQALRSWTPPLCLPCLLTPTTPNPRQFLNYISPLPPFHAYVPSCGSHYWWGALHVTATFHLSSWAKWNCAENVTISEILYSVRWLKANKSKLNMNSNLIEDSNSSIPVLCIPCFLGVYTLKLLCLCFHFQCASTGVLEDVKWKSNAHRLLYLFCIRRKVLICFSDVSAVKSVRCCTFLFIDL